MPSTQQPHHAAILQLGTGFWASRTLLSAVELGVFTTLAASGPLALAPLRDRLGLHPRPARDFLDALAALGMLQRDAQGRYDNTADTAAFLDRARPGYIGGILEMMARRLYAHWGRLTEALQTGQPQNEARDGGNPFDALYADPVLLEGFLRAMTGVSLPTARAVAAALPWAGRRTFVDIGCAQGGFGVELCRAQPHLQGIGFDLPPVQPIFDAYVAQAGLSDRLRFQPGSFFEAPLPSADVIVMGHILHDWGLGDKRMLLRKAHEALAPGGAVVVYDAMIDDDRRSNVFGLLMSLNMLIETPEGFDYSGADCAGWLREAGFREIEVIPLAGPYSVAMGVK